MRKRTFAKWAALGACVVFVLCFAGAVTINYPCYPAFKKEVNSFDNLQKILRNTPGVFYRMFPQKSSTVGNMH